MNSFVAPLRLRLDGDALLANWRWLAKRSGGAACGAAIKADGYGLGATEILHRLTSAGCRDFFVSNWAEAAALEPLMDDGLSLSVLHGVRVDDMATALASRARPVLSTPAQVARWKEAGGGACDIMVDTGMNRLGLDWRADVASLIEGLEIETLMSHLASADEDGPLSTAQLARFASLRPSVAARRFSLANSAGICLGSDYSFDLTRPGLALYGGVPRREGAGHLNQVVFPQAQILQRRRVPAGDSIGYNATHRVGADTEVAVINLGYADGYLRGFSGRGTACIDGAQLPVLGRVSMDLIAVDVTMARDVTEGDWLTMDYALDEAARTSGLSQYELLTGLGPRFDRIWH
ncbi:alanine racemase [Sphingobium sp. AN558]|uniref:alanine racemase n=1 Tax=Sphingobium sp. AN558 TaxID=3133442 RepID=UPI0030BA5FC3